jgi:hypothetical protein
MATVPDIISALRKRVPKALDGPDAKRVIFDETTPRVLLSPDLGDEPIDAALDAAGATSLADIGNGLVWHGEARPELDSPDPKTQDSVHQKGVEALAYYISFRYGDPWGIFIREEGLNYVTASVFPPTSSADAFPALQRAFRFLYLHEYFHFLTDVAAAATEIVLASPVYFPFVTRHQPWSNTCEALANAFLLRRFPRPGFRSEMKTFMRSQPDGYKDFQRWADPWNFRDGQEFLAAELIGANSPSESLPLANLFFDLQKQAVDETDVPVNLVPKKRSRLDALRFVQRILQLLETNKFRKDLSKLPRQIRKCWENKTRLLLSENVFHHSLKFQKLKGYLFTALVGIGE